MKSIRLFLVDSGKTGYIVDRQRLQSIRAQYAKKYPDFLEKHPSKTYISDSIVGQLYRNALKYKNTKDHELSALFAQMNLDDDEQNPPDQLSTVGTNDILHFNEISSL